MNGHIDEGTSILSLNVELAIDINSMVLQNRRCASSDLYRSTQSLVIYLLLNSWISCNCFDDEPIKHKDAQKAEIVNLSQTCGIALANVWLYFKPFKQSTSKMLCTGTLELFRTLLWISWKTLNQFLFFSGVAWASDCVTPITVVCRLGITVEIT